MILFYIRHGDPIYNPDSLTSLGHRQAEAIAKRFTAYGLDEIYSSPSVRAMQTAKPTCEILNKEPIILDWYCESKAWAQMTVEYEPGKLTWGYSHQPTKELFLSRNVRALGDKWYTHQAFENTKFAEGVARVENEADKLLLSFGYRHDRERGGYIVETPSDKRIALFAHEGFGMSFLSAVLGIPYNEFCTKFGIGFTGMTAIYFENTSGLCIPKVLQHSNDSHLYREGLGVKYHNRIPI